MELTEQEVRNAVVHQAGFASFVAATCARVMRDHGQMPDSAWNAIHDYLDDGGDWVGPLAERWHQKVRALLREGRAMP